MVVKVVPIKYNEPAKVHRGLASSNEDFSLIIDGVDLYVFLISSSYSRICLLIYLVYCCASMVCLLSIIFDKRRSLSRSRSFIGTDVVPNVDEEVDRGSSDSIS
jgi:hypothetical protein